MFVNCRDCLACGPAEFYTEDAVKGWNRSKATCDAIGEPAPWNPETTRHRCSECGTALVVDSPNADVNYRHCPGCRAEINQPRLF